MSSSKICLLTSVRILILKSFLFPVSLENSVCITRFSIRPLSGCVAFFLPTNPSSNSSTIFLLAILFLIPGVITAGGVDCTTIPG